MRYIVTYWHGSSPNEYCVMDTTTRRTVYRNESKSQCIANAQRLNDLSPIDGNEQTYARQVQEKDNA